MIPKRDPVTKKFVKADRTAPQPKPTAAAATSTPPEKPAPQPKPSASAGDDGSTRRWFDPIIA